MIWAMIGCAPLYDPGDPPPTIPPEPPAITAFEVSCKPETDRWTVSVDTERWTGGGALWMTAGGDWYEEHALRSTKAASDGSVDHLEAKLTIVPDWRDASPGSSTAFTCAERPGWVLVVFERAGAPADCRAADPEAWLADVPDAPGCATDTGGA